MSLAVGPGSEPNTVARLRAIGNTTPATACGIGRNERCEHQIRARDGVAERKRSPGEALDEQIADAHAEARRGDGAGKQEGGEDQPDGEVAEAGQDFRGRQRARQCQRGHGQHDAHAHADRLRDERDDRREKDAEQPALRGR